MFPVEVGKEGMVGHNISSRERRMHVLSVAFPGSCDSEPDPECIRNKVWEVHYQWFSERASLGADGRVRTKSIGYNCCAIIPGQPLRPHALCRI